MRRVRWIIGVLAVVAWFLVGLDAQAAEEQPRGPAATTFDVEFTTFQTFDGPSLDDASSDLAISAPVIAAFDMVGLSWESGSPETLLMQLQASDGTWGQWQIVPVDDEHGPDGPRHRMGSVAIYTGEADGVRFAVDGTVVGGELMVFNTAAFATGPAEGALGDVGDLGDPPDPSWEGPSFVRDRAEWDTADCRREEADLNWSTAQAIIIHHTAGSNSYGQSDVPGIIAAICSWHVDGRGWDDIGYNFLVDRYGGVWEGRTRSKTAPVQAAHTAGFNSKTQGVAMIGIFETELPTAAQLDGLLAILDWLSGWHSIDPTGTTSFAAGSGAVGFDPGEIVTAPTVLGHRDLGSTSCPGGDYYETLGALRFDIEPVDFGFDPAAVTCDGQPITRFGTPGNDLLYGTGGADVIHGLGGDDWIVGVGGDDLLCGGGGADTLVGGLGTDWVDGGSGSDTCAGELLSSCETEVEDTESVETGLYRYYNVDAGGNLGVPIRAGDDYSAGWSSIVAIDLDPDPADEIFFYRDDGTFRYYDIDADGSIGSPILIDSGYSKNWTSITPVDLDGDGSDEVFFYRTDGTFRYYNIKSNGTIGSPLSAGTNYSKGWDSITAVDLDGDGADEMFFYREDGSFRYYDVRSDGSLPAPMLSGTNYSKSWDAITAVDLDGDGADEFFFYREDGSFRFYDVRSDGSLPAPMLSGASYASGWTTIIGIDLDGDGQDEMLFYAG
jgi:hypothetical protein